MSRNVIFAGVGLFLGLGLVFAYFLTRPYSYRGSLIDPAIAAADFSLPAGAGKSFRLSDQTGKVVLMFFGYTHCTDICPASMSELKQLREKLGDQASDIQVVFITVDPQRDTPDVVSKYAAGFDPSFVGLSGSEADLSPVWKDYGIFYEYGQKDANGDYEVTHTSRIYLVDRSGNLRLTYTFGTPVDDILQDVRFVLKH
jgi:protein SCO1